MGGRRGGAPRVCPAGRARLLVAKAHAASLIEIDAGFRLELWWGLQLGFTLECVEEPHKFSGFWPAGCALVLSPTARPDSWEIGYGY